MMKQAINFLAKQNKKIKEYGVAGTITYFSISFTSLGSCYYLVKSNKGVIEQMLENRGISLKSIELGSDFVMAYIAHKTTQPLRLGLTGAIFPLVKRLVKK